MATTPDGSSQLLEPQPNHPFSIEAADSVWIVQSGKLDLFLLNKDYGGPAGSRHHSLRVEHGRAVFEIDSTRRPNTSVIATATPGTQLLCLSVSALRRATYPWMGDCRAAALSRLKY